MGHQTLIYGYISGSSWKTSDYFKLHRLNENVIAGIPEMDQDNELPYINRSMFAVPNRQGTYQQQPIAFGAAYKTLEYEWHLWLDKFEGILRQLFWWEAKIHVQFELMGEYVCEWKADYGKFLDENWDKPETEELTPIQDWTFKSDAPRKFDL